MPDKLSICNDALFATGNAAIVTLGEDTDENDVASRGYDRALAVLLERHPWNFATTTEALTQLPDAENPSQLFDYAYTIPSNALWLQSAWWNGHPIDYEIVDNKLCTDFDNAQYDVIGKYVRVPNVDETSNLFFEVLRLHVEAACLRGLNEDYAEAVRRENRAEAMLTEARRRSDQQVPRRAAFRSTMLRRVRGRLAVTPRG